MAGTHASLKFRKSMVKSGKVGRSGPTEADGGGPQRPKQASSMDIGREGAICEYIEIMQMPPGSSERRVGAYKSIDRVWQYGPAGAPRNENLQGPCGICAATRRLLSFDLPNHL